MANTTPQMSYFRRPVLAGQNMKRLEYAIVRGSVRRLDPDVISTVPYFPTSGSTTMTVDTQTSTGVGTTFSANISMTAALAALNSNLTAANAKAVEQDGCISIQSTIKGANGWIRVTGGTASAALGFDAAAGIDLFSRGGDLDSAPQGRVGNPFGTAFPGLKDDLSVAGIQRSLGRLASNSDVLWSELRRQVAVRASTPLSGTASSGVSSYNPLFLSNAQFYNGVGAGLTRLSTGDQIGPFFLIQDATTLDILPNKVVSIAVGSTRDTPTVSDAVHLSDDGGNILGQNMILWGPTAIPTGGIKNGQVIKVDHLGANSAVGNVISITGADNNSPWSNGGIRWIVDQVIDNDTVSVRPMSASEFALFNAGSSPNDGQPILELNPSRTGTQTYGSVTVYSGAFYKGNCVIITSPVLDPDQAVNVWVYQPKAIRDLLPGDGAVAELPLHLPNPVHQGRTPATTSLIARQPVGGTTAPIFQVAQANGGPLVDFHHDDVSWYAGATLKTGYPATTFLSVSATGQLVITGADATTPLKLTGAMSGANGSSNPGLILEATGTNAGVKLLTGGGSWSVSASGALVAPAASSVSTAAGNLSVTGAAALSLTATTGSLALTASANLLSIMATGATSDVTVSAGRKVTFTTAVGLCWTMDASGNLVNGSTGTLQMGTQKITGLANPTFGSQEAASAFYVDRHFVLNYGSSTTPNDNATYVIPPGYHLTSDFALDNAVRGSIVPYACTFQGIVLSVSAGPTAGTETYTVFKYSGGGSTSLVANVTVTSATTVVSDFSHTASLAAGDILYVKRTASGITTGGSSTVGIALVCAP